MDPFRVAIPEAALDDLDRRLAATRWPDELPGSGWSRGVPLAYLRELTDYWRHTYDWRAAEAELNRYPQYRTEIDGTTVHFLHVRSAVAEATPVVLTHGWPGSVVEFLDVVSALTDPVGSGGDPEDAFHLVIPSLPGYAFSGPTREPGWDTRRVAGAWAELMHRVGYDRYLAQGGDWGSPISLRLGEQDPDHVAGVHVNMCVTLPPPDAAAFGDLDDADREKLAFAQRFAQDGMGWQRIQATRPQTLAYALTDSPVGQLAWIAEKFREWSDCDVSPEQAVSRDRLLTTVMVYWLTGTAGSSAQLYFESSHLEADFVRTWGGPWSLAAPVGVAVFPKDAVRPVRRFAEGILPTLSQWTEYDRGGHFAALEQPGLFVEDLRRFARSLR